MNRHFRCACHSQPPCDVQALFVRNEEVRGSTPLGSTSRKPRQNGHLLRFRGIAAGRVFGQLVLQLVLRGCFGSALVSCRKLELATARNRESRRPNIPFGLLRRKQTTPSKFCCCHAACITVSLNNCSAFMVSLLSKRYGRSLKMRSTRPLGRLRSSCVMVPRDGFEESRACRLYCADLADIAIVKD